MNSFLDQVFLGNTIAQYLWVAGIILFVLFLNRYISKYVARLLCRLFKTRWQHFDEATFVNLVFNPIGVFLVISVAVIAVDQLTFPPQWNLTIYKYHLQGILMGLAVAFQLGAFTWLLLRIVDFIASLLKRRADQTPGQNDDQLVVFFRDFFKVIIGLIGVLLILKFAFNYNIGTLLTGLSIVGAAIALALKESLENLIASFVIFFDKPFAAGDFVKVQSVSGSVERIGLRSTRIRTPDKSFVTVPNKQMVDSILDNISMRSQIRGELNLQIHLSTPPDKIEALIQQLRGHLSTVSEVQGSTVLFND
ncbi:MAG TPA: mechanosensitive ion channel domain-containing protein, partial [Chitinophagaceae bacterium]|nr:mechanosensitive ion channel domain-containing protein [Chitinophagaceae bacterium]